MTIQTKKKKIRMKISRVIHQKKIKMKKKLIKERIKVCLLSMAKKIKIMKMVFIAMAD